MITFFNFLIDRITGFDIKHELDQILNRDFWSREEIEADQAEKFARLSEVAANSAYYKDFSGEPLNNFPVMNRSEFIDHNPEIVTKIRKPYSVQHTSGSTGYPVTLYISKEMVLAKRVSHQKMLSWYGLERESKEFKIGGLKQDLKTHLYYYLRNKRYIDSFSITEEKTNQMLRRYNRYKPKVLYGYPSAIFNFLRYAVETNKRLHQPSIIVTHAENLYPEFIEFFQEVFPGTKIVNQYWSTEANIGVVCPEGRLHFDEDTIIPEVVNVDQNGVGDLLITNLYSFDQPIIRYQIGDRVKISNEKCPCGRNSRVIESIEGRQVDQIHLTDGRKIPATSLYFSRFNQNLLYYQLVYYRSDATMEFRYVPLDLKKEINKNAIENYVRDDLGLKVKFKQVSDIEYSPGGKYKKVIQKD